jgi:hypothetical protein
MKRLFLALVLLVAVAAPAAADPKGDIIAAALNLSKATSYHMNITSQGHTVDIDFVPPGKMHMMAGPMEAITIPPATWVKFNGSWHQFTFPGVDRMTSLVQGTISGVKSASSSPDDVSVTDLGMKTVEGTPLHAYTVQNKSNTTVSTVYLDTNGMLTRVETGDAVAKFTNFNAPITIEPPA